MSVAKERFRVTGKITRLLGSESVSDAVTALQEVLKNSHDADALSADVSFYDFETGLGKIYIKEEKGEGMTYDEIKNNFLVIGTYAKQPIKSKVRKTRRLERVMVGQKGVGRFALERLGSQVKIISKPYGTLEKLIFNIDWKKFEDPDVTIDMVPIIIERNTRTDKDDSGLEIEISDLRDSWNEEGILEFEEAMKSLILPKKLEPKNAFNVYIQAQYFNISKHQIEVKLEEKAFFTLEAELNRNNIEYSVTKLGKVYIPRKKISTFESFVEDRTRNVSELTCGPVKLHVYYFPTWQKNDDLKKQYYDRARIYYGEKLHDNIPKLFNDYHGVRIYKDGLREFKYGDKGFDWAARDRISRQLSGTVQAERLIGYCIISGEHNSEIKSTTNRTEAVDNQAFRDLKDFVISTMKILDIKISNDRRAKYKAFQDSMKPTSRNLKKLETKLSDPKVSKLIHDVENELGEDLNITQLIKQAREFTEKQETHHDELMTQDEITLANASVGDYIGRLYHDYVDPVVALINTSINRISSTSKKKNTDWELRKEVEDLYRYWNMITVFFDAMDGLNSGLAVEEYYKRKKSKIALQEKIDEISNGLKLLFEFDDFRLDSQISSKLELEIFGPVIYSLLYNLLSNSIKTLKNQKKKNDHGNIISVRSKIEKRHVTLFFSDNSTEGIPKDRWETIFSERISSTSKHRILPGHGIGLYIVKRMLIYINGIIEIIPPLLGTGTSFKVQIPTEYLARN
jgi:signal transduction histidine kinase